MKKYIAVVQARMTSKRLPGKILKKINGKYLLEFVVERVKASKCDDVIVCTTTNKEDDPTVDFCKKNGVRFFRGDEADVLGRIYNSLKSEKDSVAVRITADSPLVDPEIIDHLIDLHSNHNNDVTTNYFSDTFPHGTILSVIDFKALEYLHKNNKEPRVREHIVYGFETLPKKFVVESVSAPKKWHRPDIKFTVDYPGDLELFKKIAENFEITGVYPNTADIIKFIDENKDVKNISDNLLKKWWEQTSKYEK